MKIDALVANYRFNEISGTTLIDYSGNNLNGINNGALINQTGKIDKSYLFRGSPENIVIADNPKIQFGTGDFTFCTWVNFDVADYGSTNKQGTIVSKDFRGFELAAYEGKLIAYLGGENIANQLVGTTILNIDQWYFIILERKNNIASLEINRVVEISKTITANISRAGFDLYLGSRNGGTTVQFLKGNMDATFIYNYALTETEKDAHYNNGIGIE